MRLAARAAGAGRRSDSHRRALHHHSSPVPGHALRHGERDRGERQKEEGEICEGIDESRLPAAASHGRVETRSETHGESSRVVAEREMALAHDAEARPFDGRPEGLRGEVDQVPRRIEALPMASQELGLPGIGVRDLDDQRPILRQDFPRALEVELWLGQVLQDVEHRHDGERLTAKRGWSQQAADRSEAALPNRTSSMRRAVEPRARVRREALQGRPIPTADVQQAHPGILLWIKKANGMGAFYGLLIGIAAVLILDQLYYYQETDSYQINWETLFRSSELYGGPGVSKALSYLWLNPIGCGFTVVSGYLLSLIPFSKT